MLVTKLHKYVKQFQNIYFMLFFIALKTLIIIIKRRYSLHVSKIKILNYIK